MVPKEQCEVMLVFKTHELPQKYKATKFCKIMLIACAIIWSLLLIFITVVVALEIHNFIKPFCLAILPFLLLIGILTVILCDMKKAFVEITSDRFIVVDYYLGIKREKVFSIEDIIKAETISGYSFKVRGYRFSGQGFRDLKYIVFLGTKNKYLFKLTYSQERNNFFIEHFGLQIT